MTALNAETREALRLAVDRRRRELEELVARDPLLTERWHGTECGYRHHRCRCAACREASCEARRGRRERKEEFANGCSETPANVARTGTGNGVARLLRASPTGGSLDA